MQTANARTARDWTRDRRVAFWIWWAPIGVMLSTGFLPLGRGGQAVLWTLCLTVFGLGCVGNALRCGRLHCYFTGPFLLLMALLSGLYGLGALPLGEDGWSWLGGAVGVGAVFLWIVPERIWGAYVRGGGGG